MYSFLNFYFCKIYENKVNQRIRFLEVSRILLNRFLRLSDQRLLMILIKKKLKKIKHYIPHYIAFFWGFENDNISSSKSYTATKRGISPERKLGSSRN